MTSPRCAHAALSCAALHRIATVPPPPPRRRTRTHASNNAHCSHCRHRPLLLRGRVVTRAPGAVRTPDAWHTQLTFGCRPCAIHRVALPRGAAPPTGRQAQHGWWCAHAHHGGRTSSSQAATAPARVGRAARVRRQHARPAQRRSSTAATQVGAPREHGQKSRRWRGGDERRCGVHGTGWHGEADDCTSERAARCTGQGEAAVRATEVAQG